MIWTPQKFTKGLSNRRVLALVLGVDGGAILLALLLGDPLDHYFVKEHSFLTYLSVLQLLALSFLALAVYTIRAQDSASSPLRKPFFIWLIIAGGFAFLALDEMLMIHENVDYGIHHIFHISETSVTDRIDDFIVAGYGVAALLLLYRYREEFTRYRKAFPLLKLGFIFLFVSVFVDALANRGDIFSFFISNQGMSDNMLMLCRIMEEVFEISSEGVFILAFYSFWETAKTDKGKEIQERDENSQTSKVFY